MSHIVLGFPRSGEAMNNYATHREYVLQILLYLFALLWPCRFADLDHRGRYTMLLHYYNTDINIAAHRLVISVECWMNSEH